jgi:hypothetical protein
MSKIDIIAIDPLEPINNKYAVTSVLPTGSYSKLLVRKNYPADLTITNIESKFADRFDNVAYYYCCPVDGGDVDINGDVLGV